ncbi:MAG: type IV pilus secretin PilQ [Chromatiaceae bacterium]|nr:type IV pilus secretin PilQ [Chromatiaceae bacterium]MCP5444664.1 type IV pilus secretin PilQ [Chromatiaceae bacterium]
MDKPLESGLRGQSKRCTLLNRYGASWREALLFVCLSLLFVPVQAADNVLRNIDFSALPGSSVQITLQADQPITTKPKIFTTDNPPRIALDFFGMTSGLAQKTVPIEVGMARSITAIEAGGRTRVVVNLVKQISNNIEVADDKVIITIAGSSETVAKSGQTAQASTSPVSQKTLARTTSGSQIEGVDFRRGDAGEGKVILQLSDPTAVVDMRQQGSRVILDILKTSLPDQFARKFDVADFATPVKLVEVSSNKNDVHIEISTAGEYDHLAFQADGLLTVEFRPLTKREKEEIERKRDVFTGERLSLNFQDIPVRSVLQLLADFTGLNLVTSDTVQGQITLRLQNVPWDQALDIILKARGLSMRKNGNVIMVAPTQEINQREQLELEALKQVEELAPLQFEYIQLNYANADSIKKLLNEKDNELLTPNRGSVTVDKRTNTLLLKDTAVKLESIRQVVQRLDVPVRQVMIESRVVIADNNFAKEVGVRLGFNRANQSGSVETLITGGQPGHIDGTEALNTGTFMGVHAGIESTGAGAGEQLLVNLPAPSATSAVNLLIGKVGSFLLQLELSAMQQEGRGEIISSPRVVTSDNETAVIKSGQQIPYSTVSQDGTNVEFKDAVLKLEVTPNITPDDRVIMKLNISKDNPSTSVRAGDGTVGIDTRSIETTVLVDNGETVVLGGVFERLRSDTTEKVPVLGDLPVLGFFFRSKVEKDNNSELLIFVTPKILKESLSVR